MLGDRGERSPAGGQAAGGFWVFATVGAVLVLPMCVGFLGHALTGSTTNGVLAALAATIVLAFILSRSVARDFAPPGPLGARFRRRVRAEHQGDGESGSDAEDGFGTEGAHDSEAAATTASASQGHGGSSGGRGVGPAAEDNPWTKSASHRRTSTPKPPGPPRRAGGVPRHGPRVPRGESNDLVNIAKWAKGRGVARTPIDPAQGGFVAFGVFLLPAVVTGATPRIPAGAQVVVTGLAAEALIVAPAGGAAAHI